MTCLAYIVDTDDLEFHYKHRFVLVPDDEVLNKLYNDGYEKIDNDKYRYYLSKVTGSDKDITIDESLFREAKGLGK